jgi:hypothetical protein
MIVYHLHVISQHTEEVLMVTDLDYVKFVVDRVATSCLELKDCSYQHKLIFLEFLRVL